MLTSRVPLLVADLAGDVGAEHQVARQTRRLGLGRRRPQPLDRGRPVAAHGQDRLGRTGGERRNQESLEDEVRVALGQRPVTERGRVGAHQVGDHDLPRPVRGAGRPPLVGGRVAAATPTAQAGALDLGDHALRA